MKLSLPPPLVFSVVLFFAALYSSGENNSYAVLEVNGAVCGDSGENRIWDFSHAESLFEHEAKVAHDDSAVTLTFRRNIMRFGLRGDSIYLTSFENRLTALSDSVGLPIMLFPTSVGDTAVCNVCFRGKYSTDYQCMVRGEVSRYSDASGIVIMPGDTIRDIIRIKTVSRTQTLIADTVSVPLMVAASDTLPHLIQTDYTWLSPNFALPVAHCTERRVLSGDSIVFEDSEFLILETAFLSVPDIDDVDTEETFEDNRAVAQLHNSVGLSGSLTVVFDVGLNEKDIEIILCDIPGRVYYHKGPERAGPGVVEEKVPVSGLPGGQYLLVVKSGSDIVVRQIIEL